MDQIVEALNRVIAAPQKRATCLAPTVMKGCLSDKQVRTLATVLDLYVAGATLAIATVEIANRAGPNVNGMLLKKVNREACELLDEIEEFEPLVKSCLKYATKFRRYELRELQLVDAIDDQLFECEVKIALLRG